MWLTNKPDMNDSIGIAERDNARFQRLDSACAVIGMATFLPGANEPRRFWTNILGKVNSITEIPADRWDWRLYYDADPAARDKMNSRWGGFIEEVPFDPLRFGIPPGSVASIDPTQLLALEAVRRALADAGYADREFDREHSAVIIGAAKLGILGMEFGVRVAAPPLLGAAADPLLEGLPEWNGEVFPGIIANIIAGRVSNRLGFGGPSYTVDAACASSLTAVGLGMDELVTGRSNLVIAGGVDGAQSPMTYMCFSKAGALSPRGKLAAFDRSADGTVISEGSAIVILKRLADAERDGDRIYAVLRGWGSASDGKALGLMAPLAAGQMRAIRRCYECAGYAPSTLGFYEAHATGTSAGDEAELAAITSVLRESAAPARRCALGGVKALIGHTKATAGAAGLVKAIQALYYRTLPPQSEVENPLASLADPASPVYLLKEARPWFEDPAVPRRTGVSAFGFGGTNCHVALEEYGAGTAHHAPGADAWPRELLVFTAENRAALAHALKTLREALGPEPQVELRDLAYSLAMAAESHDVPEVILAVVAKDFQRLVPTLKQIEAHLANAAADALPAHVFLATDRRPVPQVAFLFPGQGSQYPEMAREVCLYFDEMRQAVEDADRCLKDRLPEPLHRLIYPPAVFSEAERQGQCDRLWDTRVAQPALAAIEAGFLDLATRLGLRPDRLAGHSCGEYAALHAAGVLSRSAFYDLVAVRGAVMAEACRATPGAMIAIAASPEEVKRHLSQFGSMVIANRNAPNQTVVAGPREAVAALCRALEAKGVAARLLEVAGAFHSPAMAAVEGPLNAAIAKAEIKRPRIPVYCNETGRPCEPEPEAIRTRLERHLLHAVDFVAQVRQLHADGVRVFVELGPRRVLTALVDQILGEQPHVAVALDGGGGLEGFLRALGCLVCLGVPIRVRELFAGREVRCLDLQQLAALARKPDLPSTTWLVHGLRGRPAQDPKPVFPISTRQAWPTGVPAGRVADGDGGADTPADPQVTVAIPDREALNAMLVDVVSASTGYPPAMLGVEQDMEAELGIDSIKRAEILVALRKRLPSIPDQSIQGTMCRLARIKTLRGLADALLETTFAQAGAALPLEPLPRYGFKARAQALVRHRCHRMTGLYLVTEDGLGIARGVADALEQQGARAVVVPAMLLSDVKALWGMVEKQRLQHGAVRAILHLAPLVAVPDPATVEEWHRLIRQYVVSLFHLVQGCAADLQAAGQAGQGVVLSATWLGGAFGRNGRGGSGLVASGGVAGFLRGMAVEWPGCAVRILDFDESLPPPVMGRRILEELLYGEGSVEAGFQRGERTVFEVAPSARPPANRALMPDADWVVLATGGARGITAETLAGLIVPGMRVMIAGRSPLPPGEDFDTVGLQTPAELRQHLVACSGIDGYPTAPAEIEKRLERIMAARAMTRNLERFRQAGARVEYIPVDVRDAGRFAGAITGIYERYGRLDVVLHGAGIIEDKLIVDKQPESFDRVLDTKADSAFTLRRCLRPESLKALVFFSSIAARFGNPGQADYATANEILNRLAWQLDREWPLTRVVAVNWGPWAQTGMAAARAAHFRDQGIMPIPVEAGVEFLINEIRQGSKGEVEIIAGKGPWYHA